MRASLGGRIKLDPASSAAANAVVQADAYFDRTRNGLVRAWADGWFCNPPYSSDGGAATWVAKMHAEALWGRHGIALLNATPDRNWFRLLWRYALCFLDSRVQYLEAPEQRYARVLQKLSQRLPLNDAESRAQTQLAKLPRVHGLVRGPQPTHGNVLVCFGPDTLFCQYVRELGTIVTPQQIIRRT